MIRSHLFSCFAGVSLLLSVGCGSDDGTSSNQNATPDAATSAVDGGSGERPISAHNGVVVVGSDYVTSAVSFLDTDGNVINGGCFTSSSGGVGLTLTLSNDVVLPSQIPPGGPVALIDRSNAVVTWLDPATCAPLRQLSVSTGFFANPHDLLTVSANKAYVTRAGENTTATPAPDDFDDGDDLLIVDPTVPAVLGRVDLKPFAATDGKGVLPTADRAIVAEGRVFVSLNQISGDWKSYGTGRVVIIDPATDQAVGAIDLSGAKNCGAMTYLAAERKILVACNGAYSDAAQQAATSAVVAIDLSVTPPAVVATVPASVVGGSPFSGGSLAALSSAAVLAVTAGNTSNLPPDRLWSLALDGTLPKMAFESAEGFALGAVLADASTGRVFLADAPTSKPTFLRVFDSVGGVLVPGATVKTDPAGKLPPRALAFY
jgi:hypothetical protein